MGDNGEAGLGEASPLPGFSGESIDQAARQTVSLATSLMGLTFAADWLASEDSFNSELDDADLSPSARFGIELALWNLYAASEGKSFAEILCPSPVVSVPVNGLLDGPPGEVLAEGRQMREAGYEAVKLKVGGRRVEEDAELVRDLREVLGEDVALRLDANRVWSFAEASSFARSIEGTGYEYIEEPLADPSGLTDLVREHGVPVALDESLVGMEPENLARQDHVQAVVIKPTLIGGISRTLRLSKEARRLGIIPVMSSAYETGVGTGALPALSAATGGGRIAAGLDAYRRLGADVLHPSLDITAPRIDLRETNNVDRELRHDRLKVLHSHKS